MRYARSLGVTVGERCRLLSLEPSTFGSEPWLISLGNHVSITGGVRFATHDGGVWVFREEYPEIDVFGRIDVGDNVFIGMNCLILPGTRIGSNSVIGAGSVVRGDLAGNAVYAGVPARHVSGLQDYRTRALKEAVHVRSLRPTEKRDILLQHLGIPSAIDH